MSKFTNLLNKILGIQGNEPAQAPANRPQAPVAEPCVQAAPESAVAPAPEPEAPTEVAPEPAPEVKVTPEVTPAPEPKAEPVVTPEAPTASEEQPTQFKNAIDTEDKLYRSILNALRPHFQGGKTLNKSLLCVLVDDIHLKMTFSESINDGTFSAKLKERIYTEWGIEFAKIEVSTTRYDDLEYAPAIDGMIYYYVAPYDPNKKSVERPKDIVKHATISVYAPTGYGSLKQNRYILHAQEVSRLPGGQCNIGAGNSCNIGGIMRTNHIAIDDAETSPEFERNKYVSRAHAHIKYDPRMGFILFADKRGLKISGKRTQVLTGDVKKELTSTFMYHILHDGDIIILSKNVSLIFNTINQ